MGRFFVRNTLYWTALLAIGVALYTYEHWATMPIMQRMVSIFFVAIVMHTWEESRFPGGFVELITQHLHFTADRGFGEIITASYVLVIAFVPLFFPSVVFLLLAPMMLGILEVIMHTAMIRMFHLKRPYSPGLATAVFLLLPISLYSMIYAVYHNLVAPSDWLFAFLYMAFGLVIAQQIVIRGSGMKYMDFLRNVRKALASGN